ncbi:DUF2793 domain-containing protein [Pelagibacterium montanilacus]|uniref:DUF2793 domain-containing protein n=1 Tax=Pelagibacterium montanilacus TaxID=2185280 RepID=UPI000F8F2635|nr:DUF2793 domain-containing protein [Pelagibacterium montanilacus]
MTETARLTLPLIAPEQAQKHVTHNEAILVLDGLVHLVLDGIGTPEPPADSAEGAAYFTGEEPTGDWAGHGEMIAIRTQGGWRFASPGEGWSAWDRAEARRLTFLDGQWRIPRLEVPGLGVGTAPDPVNLFAARTPAALFAALESGEGGSGDIRLVLNREGTGHEAGLDFQTGWQTGVQLGQFGSAEFALRVSTDGAPFTTALGVAPDGFVRFGQMMGLAQSAPMVAGGVLAVATSRTTPQPEAGSADDIDTISGGADGALLVCCGSAGMTLTFRAGTGNLRLGADRVLAGPFDTLVLVRHGADWLELSHSTNT